MPTAANLVILCGLLIGLVYGAVGLLSLISFLPILSFVAAAIYLADVRPKVRSIKGSNGGSSHMGPYGPW